MDGVLTEVNEFVERVVFYQKDYPWLLLFSTPKILVLSGILSQSEPSVFSIVCEIIHIANAKWEDMESEIEVIYTENSV